MGNENTKLCETCRHPYESEDHLCRKAMPASDGGPAFPVSADVAGMEGLSGSALGMTMRDYFAAKAMQNMADMSFPAAAMAKRSYELADAMLRAREQQPRESVNAELLEASKEAEAALRNVDAHMNERIAAAERVEAAIARATGGEA